jgi:hypothetical protein
MKYSVYYGITVPFKCAQFKTWKETTAFIRAQLDNDNQIHSVHDLRKDAAKESQNEDN